MARAARNFHIANATNPAATSADAYVRQLGESFKLRSVDNAVRAFCGDYLSSEPRGENATIRDWVVDLFHPLTDVNAHREKWTTAQVGGAVEGACRRFGNDPHRFIASVSASLQLTPKALEAQIRTACSDVGNRIRLERRYPGMYAHPDNLVALTAAKAGVAPATLKRGIESVCRRVRSPITLP